MKERHIHQEVFISTTTSLAQKMLENSADANNVFFSNKLEQCFWQGLLNEMFCELVSLTDVRYDEMFIWSIYTGESYLLIDRADIPHAIDLVFSIDPHLFLAELNLN